jgi:hypothetical protein
LYCLCTTYGFRLVILLSLYHLRLSFCHCIVSVLLGLSLGHCIVSVLLTALVWSLYCLWTTYGFRLVTVLTLYYLRISYGHCIVSVLLTALDWPLYCLCTTYAFAWSLYCLCSTKGFRLVIVLSMYHLRFRLVIVLSLDYLRLSFGHFIVSVLLTALVCHCIVSGLPMAFIWSLYCLCTTYDFHLVIVLSLYYVRLSFGHCIVSVLFTAFVCSLYCLCATYGFSLSLYCIWTTYGFRLVIILSLYYVGLSFGHCIVSGLLTALVCHCIVSGLLMAFVWSLYCLCTTYGSRLVN